MNKNEIIKIINKYDYIIDEVLLNFNRQTFLNRSKIHIEKGYRIRKMCINKAAIELIMAIGTKGTHWTKLADFTIYLNSFYINLRGAIENLCWAYCYESKLINEIDPEDKLRFEVDLLNGGKNKMKKSIVGKFPTFEKRIQFIKNWYLKMKDYRDPIAHRVPLSMAKIIESFNVSSTIMRRCFSYQTVTY